MIFPIFNRLSLKLTLVIYVIVPLTLAFILTGYLTLKVWEDQVETRMRKDVEMVARAIQLPLSHAMERDRTGGIKQALESAFSLDSVYGVYAYDLDGKEIATAGKRDPSPERGKLTKLALKGEQVEEYGRIGERRVYSYFIPLKDSRDQVAGLLQLTRRERDFRQYVQHIRFHALVWFTLALSVIILLVLFGQHRAQGRHLQCLMAGMRRVAAGELGHRISPDGPVEIASLTKTFNQMLDHLQNAQKEIQNNRQEQHVLERRLRQSEKLAAIGQLAAGVAHELGTPLGTISGIAQRRLRKLVDIRQIKPFQRIKQEVERMEVIIRQLLDFSHGQRLTYRLVHPASVAESAATAVAEEAEKRRVRLVVEGSEDALTFLGDPLRIEQALVNLLSNAIQADKLGRVILSWKKDEDSVVFSVEDGGPGIPEIIRDRLFEPFFTTKPVGEGTGLGMAVVHGVADEHGGCVEIGKSKLGGAKIDLRIPSSSSTKKKEL